MSREQVVVQTTVTKAVGIRLALKRTLALRLQVLLNVETGTYNGQLEYWFQTFQESNICGRGGGTLGNKCVVSAVNAMSGI